MRHYRTLLALFLFASIGADSVPEPTSTQAVGSIDKAASAQKAARESYDRAILKIKKTEVDELKSAMKAATQKADLDEANAINAVLKKVEAAVAQSDPTAEVVPASQHMLGRWKINDQNWVIDENLVRNDGPNHGIPTVQGRNIMLVKWSDGWTDLLTFEGDKAFDEGWGAGMKTSDPPRHIGIGWRVN